MLAESCLRGEKHGKEKDWPHRGHTHGYRLHSRLRHLRHHADRRRGIRPRHSLRPAGRGGCRHTARHEPAVHQLRPPDDGGAVRLGEQACPPGAGRLHLHLHNPHADDGLPLRRALRGLFHPALPEPRRHPDHGLRRSAGRLRRHRLVRQQDQRRREQHHGRAAAYRHLPLHLPRPAQH